VTRWVLIIVLVPVAIVGSILAFDSRCHWWYHDQPLLHWRLSTDKSLPVGASYDEVTRYFEENHIVFASCSDRSCFTASVPRVCRGLFYRESVGITVLMDQRGRVAEVKVKPFFE
jgi:hypothetical protein